MDLTIGLDQIMSLRPVTFNWLDPSSSQDTQQGFIAQEVQTILPSSVFEMDNGILTVDYASLVVPVIGAIQEQQGQIENTTIQITNLSNQVSSMQSLLNNNTLTIDGLTVNGSSLLSGNTQVAGNLTLSGITSANMLNVSGEASFGGGVVIGGANGSAVFDSVTGQLIFTGDARHTKTISLSPQYEGAVIDSDSDIICASNNNGVISTGYDMANYRNYYSWTSNNTSKQCKDIIISVKLPTDFSEWVDQNSIDIEAKASSLMDTGYAMAIYNATSEQWDDSYGVTYNSQNGLSSIWGNIITDGFDGDYQAGDRVIIKIRLSASNGTEIRLGDITLKYLAKF